MEDRVDIEVRGQLRNCRLVMSAVSKAPLFEIFAFLFVFLDFDVGVTVRSELRPLICNLTQKNIVENIFYC